VSPPAKTGTPGYRIAAMRLPDDPVRSLTVTDTVPPTGVGVGVGAGGHGAHAICGGQVGDVVGQIAGDGVALVAVADGVGVATGVVAPQPTSRSAAITTASRVAGMGLASSCRVSDSRWLLLCTASARLVKMAVALRRDVP
jgi:hypothetical protein